MMSKAMPIEPNLGDTKNRGQQSATVMADYQVKVIWGSFIRRVNRFCAQVRIDPDEEPELAHVPSSGRMGELLVPGATIGLLHRPSPKRKTQYTAAFVEYCGNLVSIDSHLPNHLVAGWLATGRLSGLPPMDSVTAEVKFASSRFDFSAFAHGRQFLIEVKSVTLVENGVALFPDAPTTRGARHVRELITAKSQGLEAAVIFVIQREDGRVFTPNSVMDPHFAAAVRAAKAAGVEIFAYACSVRRRGSDVIEMGLRRAVPVDADLQILGS